VPGDLSGLTQPARALSAPSVTGTAGDGLRTMEEILSLELDADWVVAVGVQYRRGRRCRRRSGLGPGPRLLCRNTLVTNWSVRSASAREVVSDLFRRHTSDAGLTQGETLRQAMSAR